MLLAEQSVAPIQVPVEAAPPGSSAVDVEAGSSIAPSLLAYLSASARSRVLTSAASGSAVASKLAAALGAVDSLADVSDYRLDSSPLSGLADGATSAAFTAPLQGSPAARLVILLDAFQPAPGGAVIVSGGGAAYSLALPLAASAKRLEFASVPAALAASFTVKNGTGAAFPAGGNAVVVIPL
jgi:hypothetical protein